MAKGFHKYLGNEDKLQHQVMNFIHLQYPDALCAHVPNEGRRTPFERFKFKYLGGKSGIPDVLIFDCNDNFNGLAIELKAGNNKATRNQVEWLDRLNAKGWATYCLNDYKNVVDVIKKYFGNEI
jgi:hypothetical protein